MSEIDLRDWKHRATMHLVRQIGLSPQEAHENLESLIKNREVYVGQEPESEMDRIAATW